MGEDVVVPETLTFYPFAYALLDDELSNYCWYCLTEINSRKKCTGCQLAYFCGKQCQAFGWKDHRVECKGFRSQTAIPSVEIRLLGRIITRFKAIESGKDQNDPSFYTDRRSKRTIMEIWSHAEDMRKDTSAWSKFESIFARLTEFYGEKALVDKETLFQLHCRDFINRHAISDRSYLKEIGKGLYLDLCAYDHSCRPNAIFTCNGFVATLRGLNSGVDLNDKCKTFYTYINLFTSKQQRKKMLADSWYFDCECSRCADNDEHMLTSMKCPFCSTALCMFGDHDYKNKSTQIITCRSCLQTVGKEKVVDAVKAMRFVDRILEHNELEQMTKNQARLFLLDLIERFSEMLPKVNIYYCHLLQALIPLSDPDDLEKLLEYHLDALECMRICYPANHPSLAYHLMAIGTFCTKLKRKTQAIQFVTESQKSLDFVLGKDHPMSETNRAQFQLALNLT